MGEAAERRRGPGSSRRCARRRSPRWVAVQGRPAGRQRASLERGSVGWASWAAISAPSPPGRSRGTSSPSPRLRSGRVRAGHGQSSPRSHGSRGVEQLSVGGRAFIGDLGEFTGALETLSPFLKLREVSRESAEVRPARPGLGQQRETALLRINRSETVGPSATARLSPQWRNRGRGRGGYGVDGAVRSTWPPPPRDPKIIPARARRPPRTR